MSLISELRLSKSGYEKHYVIWQFLLRVSSEVPAIVFHCEDSLWLQALCTDNVINFAFKER
jgi:hypothetical protein